MDPHEFITLATVKGLDIWFGAVGAYLYPSAFMVEDLYYHSSGQRYYALQDSWDTDENSESLQEIVGKYQAGGWAVSARGNWSVAPPPRHLNVVPALKEDPPDGPPLEEL